MARKVMLPELYEVIDTIGTIMVTNQTKSSRDAARAVYVHFLLSYPQSKSRWTKQLKFLLRNLEYKHVEGRQSVMEAMNVLITKMKGEQAEELNTAFLIPVVLRMANDESKECREMAALLLGQLFGRANRDQKANMLQQLRTWAEQGENQALINVALQAYEVFFDVCDEHVEQEVILVRKTMKSLLRELAGDVEIEDQGTVHNCLKLWAKLCQTHPSTFLSSQSASLWAEALRLHTYAEPQLQLDLAHLYSVLFTDIAKANPESKLGSLPVVGTHGLELSTHSMESIMKHCLWTLNRLGEVSELTTKVVQNLLFLGRATSANSMTIQISTQGRDEHENEEHLADESDEMSISDNEVQSTTTLSIPAIQYLLHRSSIILRREPTKYTTTSLTPKHAITTLLTSLVPHLNNTDLTNTLAPIIATLLHFTSPQTIPPRSHDPAFAPAYAELVTSAQLALEAMHARLGDAEYVRMVSAASRGIRERGRRGGRSGWWRRWRSPRRRKGGSGGRLNGRGRGRGRLWSCIGRGGGVYDGVRGGRGGEEREGSGVRQGNS